MIWIFPTDVAPDTGARAGAGAGVGAGAGTGTGTGAGLADPGPVGAGVGADMVAGVGTGVSAGVGAGARAAERLDGATVHGVQYCLDGAAVGWTEGATVRLNATGAFDVAGAEDAAVQLTEGANVSGMHTGIGWPGTDMLQHPQAFGHFSAMKSLATCPAICHSAHNWRTSEQSTETKAGDRTAGASVPDTRITGAAVANTGTRTPPVQCPHVLAQYSLMNST